MMYFGIFYVLVSFGQELKVIVTGISTCQHNGYVSYCDF